MKNGYKEIPEMHDDFFSLRVDPMLACGSVSRSHLMEALGQQEVTDVSECLAVIKHTAVKDIFNTSFDKCKKVIKKNTNRIRMIKRYERISHYFSSCFEKRNEIITIFNDYMFWSEWK